jgi:LytS/YehU family sensor histidine kinase
LNNLYALALEQSSKTPETILGLSSILRYMIYDCKEEEVFLSKEVEHIENYIQLYQLQLDKRAKIEFEQDVLDEQAKISPLILIIFIENAFKHSSSSQLDEIHIHLKIKTENGRLIFYCANNFKEESNINDLDKGVGLQNVHERLELLYKNQYSLEIEEKDSNYIVQLSIPLSYD